MCLYLANVTNRGFNFVAILAQPIYFSNSSGVLRSNSFLPSLNLLKAEGSQFGLEENQRPGFFTFNIFSVCEVRSLPVLKISIKCEREV